MWEIICAIVADYMWESRGQRRSGVGTRLLDLGGSFGLDVRDLVYFRDHVEFRKPTAFAQIGGGMSR